MSALAWMMTTGVGVGLTPEGGLELDGLERLDDDLYARVVEVARTSKAEIVAELQGGPVPSPALAELDRFFAAAVEHVFPDGTTGWIDPTHKFPAIEMVLCPVMGGPSPRASCTEHNGCPDMNTCKAFKRPLAGRK